MQRPTYGQSPPLHHPVPQHVSTVPQLRSPPPPPGSQPQSQNYSNPYQPHAGAGAGAGAGGAAAPNGNVFGQYGNFMNEPTAQFAAQFGQSAFKHGQEYLEQNVSCLDFDSQPRCRYERLQKSKPNNYACIRACKKCAVAEESDWKRLSSQRKNTEVAPGTAPVSS